MLILGINAFHADAAACLLRDGLLVAAAEEERFVRAKHWAGFPAKAIAYCLAEAGVRLSEVDRVAVNSDQRANLFRKISFVFHSRPSLGLVVDRFRRQSERQSIDEALNLAFPDQAFTGEIEHVEHHLAHLASSFLVSPFDDAAVVSVDGFGDFSSAAWGMGKGDAITIDDRVYFPHSLGIFYQAITQYLGFPNYGDEYKVMGLAPYGDPSRLAEMREIVRCRPDGSFELALDSFRHHRERIAFEWADGSPTFSDLFTEALEKLLGPRRSPDDSLEQRHFDIARSAQAMYEEAFFNLLEAIHRRHNTTDIALAGGCAMNSVANGKIRRMTPFRRVYVQAAAGDAGGALGAAMAAWVRLGGRREFEMDHAFWGPGYDNQAIESLLQTHSSALATEGCETEWISDEKSLCERTASAVADGKVVGWFQGRMEWGPRALGNRSIVCDPRRSDMKDILNAKIKRRESFRPFAPSVLRDKVSDWFEEDDSVPFMMQVFQIHEEKRHVIPAVTHVDGSGRLQTVTRESNPRYFELIDAFRRITDVPMVLNTSFNENEPIVCTPEQAMDCFLRTKMDVLVLGDLYIERKSDHSA